ncbi:MAG: OmpH family outer membrane protein [Alphaproteobacteria bacterium]|nr:OmpH family outer membrane protein [Alphaproteobacteria bacterium]
MMKNESVKKYYKPAVIAVVAFVLGFGLKWLLPSNNIAKIDVAQIAAASSSLAELGKNQQADMIELQKWVQESQADIKNQKSSVKREELKKKYEAELIQKQQALQMKYSEELKKIDTEVSEIITKHARSRGYNVVLAKDSIVSGGTDITDEIIELVK